MMNVIGWAKVNNDAVDISDLAVVRDSVDLYVAPGLETHWRGGSWDADVVLILRPCKGTFKGIPSQHFLNGPPILANAMCTLDHSS